MVSKNTCRRICSYSQISRYFYRTFMKWRERISLFKKLNRFIKIFSFSFWIIQIVFTVHNMKIFFKLLFILFNILSFRWIRIYRLSSFPKIFSFLFKKTMIPYTIWWCFVNVFKLISVLSLTVLFIKKFFVLCVV